MGQRRLRGLAGVRRNREATRNAGYCGRTGSLGLALGFCRRGRQLHRRVLSDARSRRPPVCHQSSFSPNCTCREVVVVLVITPSVGETPDGVNTTSLGMLKFARLSKLKISARNCKFI